MEPSHGARRVGAALRPREPRGIMSESFIAAAAVRAADARTAAPRAREQRAAFANVGGPHPLDADTVDLAAFFGACAVDERGRPPVFLPIAVDSEHNAHLALSGKSSMIFGEQYKPYPQHWGPPPNMQMKGHAGVVRDLPGGYGKGNESMEKWVRQNMEHDKRTLTNVNGVSKYPLGNYSL